MRDLNSQPNDVRPDIGGSAHYHLTLEDREGYLFAQVVSDGVTREAGFEYIRKIADRCRESNCENILVIRDIPNMLPLKELYNSAGDLFEIFDQKKLAIVNPHSEIYGRMNFLAQAYESLGGRCRIFETVSEAEKWLLEN
jgi:hypothetical protein